MLTPLVLVVVFSFGRNALTAASPWAASRFDWYRGLFANDTFWGAAENSGIVATAIGLSSTVIGTMGALGLSRLPAALRSERAAGAGRSGHAARFVIGIALMTYFVRRSMSTGSPDGDSRPSRHHPALRDSHRACPPATGFDYSLVDSARDLGASPATAFFTVTLPIVRTTIIGAALIAMARIAR